MVARDELIRRRVLFIGTSVPMECSEGLEAVQQPLRDRYPTGEEAKVEGIRSWLTVSQSGLQLEYADGKTDVILFPITSVSLCAAVRCISVINNATKERVSKFVSLSSPTAGGPNSQRPAIFTAITRRTVGKKILECHGFVCESDKDALDLVHATSAADKMCKNKQMNGSVVGHSEIQTRHETNTIKSNGHSEQFPLRVTSGEITPNAAPEFYETPPQQGFFYTTKTTPIRKYHLEKVVSDNEGERSRPISPQPLSARPSIARSAYSIGTSRPPPAVLHTLPRQVPQGVHVRTIPVQTNARPRFFSPPPTLLRPRVVSRMKDPHMMVPPPPPPMIIDGPPPHLTRSRPRRRGSESSASYSHSHDHDHASSRSSSPHETYTRRIVNGDGGDASSEVSSRPRTPPTDYDKRKPVRISRREQYDMRNYYPTVIRNGEAYPSHLPPDFYPPPGRMPVYYMERARSVPPPLERARTLDKKNKKKIKDKKKGKDKKNRRKGVPSDISMDSIGYMSEVSPVMMEKGSAHIPRDFRRFENQFKHERAFSRSLMEEKRHDPSHDTSNQSAYALNELMANKARTNGEVEPFAMY